MSTDTSSMTATPTPAAPPPALNLRGHLPALDGLRGLAIVLVLICHFTERMKTDTAFDQFVVQVVGLTRHGVDLFFVLSGFLITGILYDSKNAPRYFRNFYGRRTLRIFPLYYAVLIVYLVILPLFIPYNTPDLQDVWRSQWALWLYCSNFVIAYHREWWYARGHVQLSHFWSLAIEEQFYLIWPFLILFLSRKGILVMSSILILGAVMTRFVMASYHAKDLIIFVLTPCRLDALALGSLLAIVARTPEGLHVLYRWARWVFPLSLLLMISCFAVGNRIEWFIPTFKYSFFAFGFGALLILTILASPRTLLGCFFNSAFLRFMGKYSYGIYVFHGLFSLWMFDHFGPPFLLPFVHSYLLSYAIFVLLGSTLSVGIALLSWHAFEKHFLKLKRYFT